MPKPLTGVGCPQDLQCNQCWVGLRGFNLNRFTADGNRYLHATQACALRLGPGEAALCFILFLL